MTSNINSQYPPSVLNWLSAIETPSTSASQHSPGAQTSPSVRRKRQRSVKISTPVQKRSRTSRSLDGLKEVVHEHCRLELWEGEKACALVGRVPLGERSKGDSAFNMAANLNSRLTPKSSNISSDSSATYTTPSGSSSASIPIPGLKLKESAHNVRQILAQHGMQIDVERLREDYKPRECENSFVLHTGNN